MVTLYGVEVHHPIGEITLNGIAKDMVLVKNRLVIATDMGHIEIYNAQTLQKEGEIAVADVKDFMGDTIPARILSCDTFGEQYVLVSDSGKGGYANVYLSNSKGLELLIGAKDKEAIIKARFINERYLLLGFLSNEVALYDLKTHQERYRKQLSESKFSDFALNETKTQAVFACESGVLNVIDVFSGEVLAQLKGANVDNVYRVAFAKGLISAAGQDQRGALYDVRSKRGSYIKGSFLIYSTALSPSAKLVAFTMDEQNNISLYRTQSKEKIALLKGQKSTLNVILFQNEHRLFSASDDSYVMVWDIAKKKDER